MLAYKRDLNDSTHGVKYQKRFNNTVHEIKKQNASIVIVLQKKSHTS